METASLLVDERAADGEPGLGFEELYERHSKAVYLTALRVTGNPADAEDVLQTIFLRVHDGRLAVDATWSPGAYLRRAAANAAIDVLRRRRTRRETEIDERREARPQGPPPPGAGAEGRLLLKEQLREALSRLSPENAELFVLCYLEGYTYDELADMLHMERGTVGSRLHRIRATLQKDLAD
jgi:RNA polymerase sigma-70 factor (ECF subfamily)